MDRKSILLNTIAHRCWLKKEVKLASGAQSSHYINCRKMTMSGFAAGFIGELMWAEIQAMKLYPELIGGPATAAIPLVTSIIIAAGKDGMKHMEGFYTRREKKDHGLQSLIEGCDDAGKRAVIVEDVMTTGGSAIEAAGIAIDAGISVVAILGIVDREAGAAKNVATLAATAKCNIEYRTLFTLTEVMAEVERVANDRRNQGTRQLQP